MQRKKLVIPKKKVRGLPTSMWALIQGVLEFPLGCVVSKLVLPQGL